MAKGQGLPLSFIVIAAISVLILVLIVYVVVGPGGKSLSQLVQTGETSDLSTAQTACTTNCNKLQTISPTFAQFQSSDFCNKRYSVDINKNNKIDAGEAGLNCWNSSSGSINTDCTVQLSNGMPVSGAVCKAKGQKCQFEQDGKCNATCTAGTIVTGIDLCTSGLVCCVV
jgi:hypothetical protein